MSKLLERFTRVDNEVMGLRPGLILVEVPEAAEVDEHKTQSGQTLYIAKPKTHRLAREDKKAYFVTVLTFDEETGLEPGNVVLTSPQSLTAFSVYGDLQDVKEESVAIMEAGGFMQKFRDMDEYKRVFGILNGASNG